MTTSPYTPPVSELLTLGEMRFNGPPIDYLALGLTAQHLPELTRIALDEELLMADWESDEVWAPIHAWRALGQLGDAVGAAPLLKVLSISEGRDDDWSTEEPLESLVMIGPPAIEPISTFVADRAHGEWSRATAIEVLGRIAEEHPDHRDACVAVIHERLRHFHAADRIVNGMLIAMLAQLGAVEAAAEIKVAYDADVVDLSILGDWEEAQIALGLLEKRTTPTPVGGWYAAEVEREDPARAASIRDTAEMLDQFRARSRQTELGLDDEEPIDQRAERGQRLNAQRAKRDRSRKLAKQTTKKQRAKKKRKKR